MTPAPGPAASTKTAYPGTARAAARPGVRVGRLPALGYPGSRPMHPRHDTALGLALGVLLAGAALLAARTRTSGPHPARVAPSGASPEVPRADSAQGELVVPVPPKTERGEVGPSADDVPTDVPADERPRRATAAWLREVLPERYGSLTGEELAALTELDLRGAPITDDDLRHLAALPSLESLSLHGTPITDAGLAHLGDLVRLRSVVLRGTQVTGTGIRYLPVDTLEALHLCGSGTSAEDLRYLPPMPQLQTLKLNFLELDDAAVAALNVYPALRHIELDGSRIDDAGLESLLEQNPGLVRIELRNSQVTDDGVQRIVGEHPGCEVVYQSGPLPGQR